MIRSRCLILLGIFSLFANALFSQAKDLGAKLSPAEVQILVDSLKSILLREYIDPVAAQKMGAALDKNYKAARYNNLKNRSALAIKIGKDLQSSVPGAQVRIGYSPVQAKRYETQLTEEEKRTETNNQLITEREERFYIVRQELLPGNVGYVRWDKFCTSVNEALPKYDSIFKNVSACKSLIIDLRYNTGGNTEMVSALSNYFFENSVELNCFINRTNDTLKRFTDPKKTNFKLSMPVYVLCSGQTASAAEEFAYNLQTWKRAKLIGDTCAGTSSHQKYLSVGQGFIATVQTAQTYNLKTKTMVDSQGLVPDVLLPSDEAYTLVLEQLYGEYLQNAKTDAEKKLPLLYLDGVKKNKHLSQPFVKIKHSDAINALLIKDSIYGPTNVGKGFGAYREQHTKTEFKSKAGAVYLDEENSAWYKIIFERDTLLNLDIVPLDPQNDYDFVFFRCDDAACLEKVKTAAYTPERFCFSGFTSYSGSTGLSPQGVDRPVGIGPGPTYVKTMSVQAGATYYLMVCFAEQYTKQGKVPLGYTIYFHNYWPKKQPMILKNVDFESNSSVLKKTALIELDKLATQLIKDKGMNIELQGHADNLGTAAQNLKLSEDRAKAVKEYLVSKGADEKRIETKGFGSRRPLSKGKTEQARKMNRRVEMQILMK